MNCTNCGAELAEGSVFCTECGAQMESAPAPVKKGLDIKRLIPVIAAVLVVVLLIALLGGNPAEKAVNNYYKAMMKENGEKVYKTLPKTLRNYIKEEIDDDDDMEEFMEGLNEVAEEFADEYEDCKFKVLDVSKVSEDDLEDMEETFEDMADEMDIKLKLQDARQVIVKITDEDGNIEVEQVAVLKVNGSWFVVGEIFTAVMFAGAFN